MVPLSRATLWGVCFAGQFVNMVVKATFSAKSPLTPWKTVTEYVKWHWPALAFRLFLSQTFFWWWTGSPDLIDHAFDAIAANLSPGTLRSIIEGIHFPLNYGTAGLYGLLSDVGVDWFTNLIPFLKSRIPSDINPPNPPAGG